MFEAECTSGSWGENTGGLDVQLTAALEQMQVSWVVFQYVPPTGVSGDVTDPTQFFDQVVDSGLSWTPDYGNFPAVRGTYGNGGLPWTTTANFVNNQLTGTLHVEAVNYDSGGQGVSYYDTTPGDQGGTYRPGDDVNIIASSDVDGGYAVASTAGGDWFDYTINVQQPGYYDLGLRYSNATAGAAVERPVAVRRPHRPADASDHGRLERLEHAFDPSLLGLRPAGPADRHSRRRIRPQLVRTDARRLGAVSNGTYLLVNRNSGQAMQFNTTNNDVVQEPVSTSSTLEQWNLQSLGAGQYEVTSAYNGNSWNGGGSTLGMVGWWGTGVLGSEQFIVSPAGNGYYEITPVTNGMDLDVQNSSTTAGASVVQDVSAGSASQKWAILTPGQQLFPTGLLAFQDNSGNFQLSWTAAPGAASYDVQRATTSGGPYTTIATGVTATDYVNSSISANTTYYYVVNAVSSAGQESLNSVETSLASLPRRGRG